MARIRITLSRKLNARLAHEAAHSRRSPSDIVVDAVAEYLVRDRRAQLRNEIARAAALTGEDALALAEEWLPLDNEALDLAEGRGQDAPRMSRKVPRADS